MLAVLAEPALIAPRIGARGCIRKSAHRGPSRPCLAASGPRRVQVRGVHRENCHLATMSRRVTVLPQEQSLWQRLKNWWGSGSDPRYNEHGLTAREQLETQRFYALATGSVLFVNDDGTATVGRVMSPKELELMRATGRLQESLNAGVTSVSHPANPGTYRAGAPGDVYVEFDVPASAIRTSDGRTGKIYGPNSIPGRLYGVTEMPPVTRIIVP